LLDLSDTSATAVSDPAVSDAGRGVVAEQLRKDGIGFVMLNEETATARLMVFVREMMPLTFVARDGQRSLYVVNE
jgi:hypothetical protein